MSCRPESLDVSPVGSFSSGAPLDRLVLFDIDGTLMKCGSQVGRLFLSVLEEIFGTHGDIRRCSFAGKTDSRIVFDLMVDAGFEREEVATRLPEIQSRYLPRLEDQLDVRHMTLLAGAAELIRTLASSASVTLGLVTGNWERGARAKLERFDLNPFFAFGAFGDDGVDRNDLPPFAIERAHRATGRRFLPERVWIVGDTPHDVECAKEHGLSALAVATGSASVHELELAGADRVVESLADPAALEVLFTFEPSSVSGRGCVGRRSIVTGSNGTRSVVTDSSLEERRRT